MTRFRSLAIGLLMLSAAAMAQERREPGRTGGPIAAPGAGSSTLSIDPDEIVARMERRFELQIESLESYRAKRTYSAENPLRRTPASLTVEESYLAPGDKTFREVRRNCSPLVYNKVFSPLLAVERETAIEAIRTQVDLTRKNYRFTYLGYDKAASAYRFRADPIGSNPYLLRGTIWINDEDFGVERIEGEPAKRHSAFIRRTSFVHEFAKFGDYWFPVRHRSEARMYVIGRSTLEIDYFEYQWKSR